MKACSGNHPSGVAFAPQETMRLQLNLGKRNASRPDHISAVLVQYVTRQSLRNGRIPLLESLEVYITGTITGDAIVHAKCTVEPHDAEWACMVRGIEATRIEQMLGRGRARPEHQGLVN